MIKDGLAKLAAEKKNYDKESQDFIDSLQFVDKEIGIINSMKATEGWKLIERKIREELHQRINEMVKDDLKIQTLLAILQVADTKGLSKTLSEEIEKLLPSE